MNKSPPCTPTAVQMIGRNLWEISIKPCLIPALCQLRPYENIVNRSQYWPHIFLTGWDCVCFDGMGLSLDHFLIYLCKFYTCLKGFQFPYYLFSNALTLFPVFCFSFVSSPQPGPLNHICSFLSIAKLSAEAKGLLSLWKSQVKKVITLHKPIYFFCHG